MFKFDPRIPDGVSRKRFAGSVLLPGISQRGVTGLQIQVKVPQLKVTLEAVLMPGPKRDELVKAGVDFSLIKGVRAGVIELQFCDIA